MSARANALTLLVLLTLSSVGRSEVLSVEVRRQPFAGGRSFGDVGAYDQITGVVRFGLDPKNPANRKIVDLDLAPRNAQGLVEFESDLVMLAPRDITKGNGAILYDVNNRGRKLAIGFFNRSPYADKDELDRPEMNGFLMRRGYTVVWSGWLGELLPGEGRLLMKASPALENGRPVRGPVRFEFSTDKFVTSMPISRRDGHGSYPPTKEGEVRATLTKRTTEGAPRVPIARDKWKLVRMPLAKPELRVPGTLPQMRCEMEDGFEPGVLYEMIYEAEGSIVQGVALAGLRDLISFLRYDLSSSNPIRRPDGQVAITRAHGFGVSQSGRFLRHFLWQGFNEDTQGRIVFDGLIPHVAGGGLGFFNHRFAQPTRHNGQHEDHLYPCDIFPFTYGPSTDPFTGRTDGILSAYDRTRLMPRIMHTQSAAEYWHRAGSLVHTDPLGKSDALLPDNVRVYAFGGTQHGPAAYPPEHGIAQNLANPGDYRPLLRALLDSLDAWVRDGKVPPPSYYPSAKLGTLLPVNQAARTFPKIPGVKHPTVIQQPPFAEYGPEFRTLGRLGDGVPVVKGQYVVLVPPYDQEGNEIGMLKIPEVEVPLATYTGWNLRNKTVGAENQLASLLGTYVPLPRTNAEAKKSGDSRRSLETLYGTFARYASNFDAACTFLQQSGYLLAEDAEKLRATRIQFRDWFGQASK